MPPRTPQRSKHGYFPDRPAGSEGRYVRVNRGELPGFPGIAGAHQQFGGKWHRIWGGKYGEVTNPDVMRALDSYSPQQPVGPVKSETKPPGAVEVDYIFFPGQNFGFRGRAGAYTKIDGTWYRIRGGSYLPIQNMPQLVAKLEEFARGQKR